MNTEVINQIKVIWALVALVLTAACAGSVNNPAVEDPAARIAELKAERDRLLQERDQAVMQQKQMDEQLGAMLAAQSGQGTKEEPPPEKPATAPSAQVPLQQMFAAPIPVVPVLPPKHGADVGLIVGFQDEDPCADNSYERATTGFSTVANRDLHGRCLRIWRGPSWAWFSLEVDTKPTVAHFAGGLPASMCTVQGDQLPIAPPGTKLDYLMPNGRHRLVIRLYRRAATGPCLEEAGTRDLGEYNFPRPHSDRLRVDLNGVANWLSQR